MAMQPLQLTPLLSTTTGFLVLFIGKRLNLEIPFLRRFSIPEPVSGGLLVAVLLSLVHLIGGPGSQLQSGFPRFSVGVLFYDCGDERQIF